MNDQRRTPIERDRQAAAPKTWFRSKDKRETSDEDVLVRVAAFVPAVIVAPVITATAVAAFVAMRLARRPWWWLAAAAGLWWMTVGLFVGWGAAVGDYGAPYRAVVDAATERPDGPDEPPAGPVAGFKALSGDLSGWLAGMVPAAVPAGLLIAAALTGVDQLRRPSWRQPNRAPSGRQLARALDRAARSPVAADGQIILGPDERAGTVALELPKLVTHTLIAGASGSGKTTTLVRIAQGVLALGRAVVVVDLKGDEDLVEDLTRYARSLGRDAVVWRLTGGAHWNPVARGDRSQRADVLVASEEWSEPHYQRIAERYLQWVFRVLEARGIDPPTLGAVVELLDPKNLGMLAVQIPDRALRGEAQAYIDQLDTEQKRAIAGFANRFALLTESTTGPWLAPPPTARRRPRAAEVDAEDTEADGDVTPGEETPAEAENAPYVDLLDVLDGDGLVIFSLDSSAYPGRAAQIGNLVIQDIQAAGGQRLRRPAEARPPSLVMVDEFSALEGDNILGLLARGRGAGLGVVLATQELADLDRAGTGFADQVIGNTATKIVHLQQVPESAERFAAMAGTHRAWGETVQVEHETGLVAPTRGAATGLGSLREIDEFVVHPNTLKRLDVGEAVLLRSRPHDVRVFRVLPPGDDNP